MSVTITRADLRAKIQTRFEVVGTDYVTPTELNTYINDSISAWYDLMVGIDPSYFLATATVAVLSGTESYALPATFLKLIGVDRVDSSATSGYVAMERFVLAERFIDEPDPSESELAAYDIRGQLLYLFPPPTWAGTLRLLFIPVAPVFTADSGSGGTWDTINSWLEWVVLDVGVALAFKSKDLELVALLQKERDRAEARLGRVATSRDRARPKRIINRRRGY